MSNEHQDYIKNRLLTIKAGIDSRLESLIELKTSHSRLSFDDID